MICMWSLMSPWLCRYKDSSLLIHPEVFAFSCMGFVFVICVNVFPASLSTSTISFFSVVSPPPTEHAKASPPLIISVNLWLSLGAGQWLTTLPVSQTLITAQVTHRPGNDWHEMETSLILWAPELKWNISWGRDGDDKRAPCLGLKLWRSKFHYISFFAAEERHEDPACPDKGSIFPSRMHHFPRNTLEICQWAAL